MAGRIRTIKPEFFDSPHTAKASLAARYVYIALWSWADDTGRGTLNLKALEGFIFPFDDIQELTGGKYSDVSGILRELPGAYGVVFYEVEGRLFYDIPSWERHQRSYRGRASKFPGPDHPKARNLNEKLQPVDGFPEVPGSSGKIPPGTGEQGNRGTGEQGTPYSPPPGDEHTPAEFELEAPTVEETLMGGFDEFWKAYPRHVARKAAERAWLKVRKRGVPVALLIEASQRYRDDPNRKAEFTAHPTTWLNQGRWEDDPLPARGGRVESPTDGWLALAGDQAPPPLEIEPSGYEYEAEVIP